MSNERKQHNDHLSESILCALRGMSVVLPADRNPRTYVLMVAASCVMNVLLKASSVQWFATLISACGAFSAEMLNTALERLCYTGNRGMGALEFLPLQAPASAGDDSLDVENLRKFAAEVLNQRKRFSVRNIKGRPLSEAMQLTNKAVTEALDGLPAHKLHCSVLAEEAIQSALEDYRRRQEHEASAE